MNEEQTVLNFFSQTENLPLALVAAEHLDEIRLQHNNCFWSELNEQLATWLSQQSLAWRNEITKDRNNEGTLVGLHLEPLVEQRVFLRPFMEQQLMGEAYRIYYGLMWSSNPEPSQKSLAAVESLRNCVTALGFKNNDSFLAWQWSPWYPRRKDFLLRFSKDKDTLLSETMAPWLLLLKEHGKELLAANSALNAAPHSATISLAHLHDKTSS